jgi:pimeloyl-ACP methyl ester carboxylesterase
MSVLLISIKAFAVVLSALVGTGVLYQNVSTVLDKSKYPPIGTMVDIGGYKLHMIDRGVSKIGAPTVILDAGISNCSFDWALVQPEIAQFARVISYDRAGYAWSDISPLARTTTNMVDELHMLLQKASIPGPYILVGHSMGGIIMQQYAHTHSKEVAGIVLVESAQEDEVINTPQPYKILTSLMLLGSYTGLLRLMCNYVPQVQDMIKKYPSEIRALYCPQKSSTKFIKTVLEEGRLFKDSCHKLKQRDEALNYIPLTVITGGKQITRSDVGDRFSQSQVEAMNEVHQKAQQKLVTKSLYGKQLIAENSGHMIPYDQPEIIVEAVRDIANKLGT